MKKLNMKVRLKNIWVILPICTAILTALNWDISLFTSWGILFDKIKELVSNPYMLITVFTTILGIINDPTTKGIHDSEQVLTYEKPKK